LAKEGIALHQLTTWWDVLKVARRTRYLPDATLDEVEKFLRDPAQWSAAHGGASEFGRRPRFSRGHSLLIAFRSHLYTGVFVVWSTLVALAMLPLVLAPTNWSFEDCKSGRAARHSCCASSAAYA